MICDWGGTMFSPALLWVKIGFVVAFQMHKEYALNYKFISI